MTIVLWTLFTLASTIVGIIFRELCETSGRALAPKLVKAAARRLPPDRQEIREEEWLAIIAELQTTRRPLFALIFGCGAVLTVARLMGCRFADRLRQASSGAARRLGDFSESVSLAFGMPRYAIKFQAVAVLVLTFGLHLFFTDHIATALAVGAAWSAISTPTLRLLRVRQRRRNGI